MHTHIHTQGFKNFKEFMGFMWITLKNEKLCIEMCPYGILAGRIEDKNLCPCPNHKK